MNTEQITAVASRLMLDKGVVFLGVYPKDKVPRPTAYPACFVANTDPVTKPGEHWVAFYCMSPNYFEFFDSYGQSPSAYGFPHRTPHYNRKLIQSLTSSVCGQYCLFYIYFRSVGYALDSIVMQFHPHDFEWNDHLVTRWVNKLGSVPVIHTSSIAQCCCAYVKK